MRVFSFRVLDEQDQGHADKYGIGEESGAMLESGVRGLSEAAYPAGM